MTEFGKYKIKLANPTGGKAGKGCNVTSTIQVFYHDFVIKQVRYKVGDGESFEKAVSKVKRYIGMREKDYLRLQRT